MLKTQVRKVIVRILCLASLLCVSKSGLTQEPGKHQYPALPFVSEFGGPFKLTDHSGTAVTNKDFHGRYVLLFFGYTDCADICVLALHTIGRALTQTEPLSNIITPLFVNLDPEKDSLYDLEQYVLNFHPRFVGLTGSERALAMAAGAYGIRYRNVKNDEGMTEMIHSGKIFLIGPEGKVLTYLPHESSVNWMTTVIREYLDDTLKRAGALLYKQFQCQLCHGEGGARPVEDGYPIVAGQNKSYAVRQLIDIRDGVRDNGQTRLMRPLMESMTDAEAAAIAEYLYTSGDES